MAEFKARIVKATPSTFEKKNMISYGYKYYVLSKGESRAWFKTKKEAMNYLKGIEKFGGRS